MSVYVKAVRRAAEIMGIEGLSKLLGAHRADIADWVLLGNPPPVAVFLKAVDVISEHDVSALRRRSAQQVSAGRPSCW